MKYKEYKNIIIEVVKDSIGEEIGLRPGDELISINGKKIRDYIDYKYQISEENIILSIKKENGEQWDCEIEKDYDEELGIDFENPLMDKINTCRNNCMFCFIDQLPKGLRKSLYIKDDDSRLSFLYGNFITLTNLSDDDIRRIISYHISPIKISVHTTNSELRKMMIGNKNAGNILEILRKFSDASIAMDCQIVLCRGINDEKELDRTLDDLSKMHPNIRSVAVVPVGITKYRQKLKSLEPFDKKSSLELLNQIEQMQKKYLNKLGTRFVFASDEFYILSENKIPLADEYEDFNLIENGVGLLRNFDKQINDTLIKVNSNKVNSDKEYTVVTGVAAYKYIKEIVEKIKNESNNNIKVKSIKNNYFGKNITVAGLVTGRDIIEQLKNDNCKNIIIPKCMLKSDEDIFLDDVSIKDIENQLDTKVHVCDVDGEEFVKLLIG